MNRFLAVLVAGAVFAVVFSAPTVHAQDDLCAGADPDRRDINDPLVWTSSQNGATIYNAFTPVKPYNGDVWDGIREYAGVCGIIQEIADCLADARPPDECLPE